MNFKQVLVGAAFFGLVACEMESPIVETSQEFAVQEGMVKFASVEAFEAYVAQGQGVANVALDQAPFTSLGERLEDASEIEQSLTTYTDSDEFLPFHLFNEEGFINIGGWAVKVDMARELVGVVEASNATALAALKSGDVTQKSIRWFSTQDDVLVLLEEGSFGTQELATVESTMNTTLEALYECVKPVMTENVCNFSSGLVENTSTKKTHYEEYQCGDYHSTPYESEICKRWLADAKHTYQAAGVYFSLQSKIKYRGNVNCISNSPLAINTDLTVAVTYYYEKRVRFGRNQKRSGTHNNSTYNNELNYRAYEGSRSLAEYRLDSQFTYRRKDDCSTNHGCLAGSGTVRTITLPRISG